MLKRLITILILGLCVAWSIFSVRSLLVYTPDHSYLAYFSEQDSMVVAIHHPRDINVRELKTDANPTNLALVSAIQKQIKNLKTIYVSKSRNLIVISLHENWNFTKVRNVFEGGIYSFKKTGQSSFKFGKYRGEIKRKELCLYAYDLKLTKGNRLGFDVDPQASYSLIEIKSKFCKVNDVYIKPEYKITYGKDKAAKNLGTLVDDFELFGAYLPEKPDNYVFYEKNYLIHKDTAFSKSPLKDIIKTGLSMFNYKGTAILVCDIKNSIDLAAYLNEVFHLPEENNVRTKVINLVICDTFSKRIETNNLVAYSQDGIGFIAADERALDDFLLELNMRKTTLSKEGEDQLDSLEIIPKKCSFRRQTTNSVQSVSWIDNQMLSIDLERFIQMRRDYSADAVTSYFTMNPGTPIVSFCALTGRGNVILETESQLLGYTNGRFKWSQTLDNPMHYKPIRLETSLVENDHILVPMSKELRVIDRMGRTVFAIKGSYLHEPVQTMINSHRVFGLVHEATLVFYSSDDGKEVKRYANSDYVVAWKPMQLGEKVGVGIKTNSKVYFLDFATGKKMPFSKTLTDFVAFTSNGAIFKGAKGMEFSDLENTIPIQVPSNWSFSGELISENTPGLLFRQDKTLALSIQGKIRWKVDLNLSEITEMRVCNKRIFIRDGLENKLLVLNSEGQLIDHEIRPSEKEIQATPFGNFGSSVSTFLSGFIIQYNF